MQYLKKGRKATKKDWSKKKETCGDLLKCDGFEELGLKQVNKEIGQRGAA